MIKDIDTDTLNVDLAEQYVNLGEYDSAKRLLDEIKDSNNTALVERATALRQRIVFVCPLKSYPFLLSRFWINF